MKKGIFSIAFIGLVALTACKKETPEPTNNGNPTPTPTEAIVMGTGVFNYLNDGGEYNFQAINYVLHSDGQAGVIIQDSTLDIHFQDKTTERYLSFRIEGKTIPIAVGTYDIETPYTSSSPYRFSMASSGADLPLFFEANSNTNNGFYYNGAVIDKYAQLTITEITATTITGTFSADMYFGLDYSSGNPSHTDKLEVRNLNFSGTFQRVN